MYYHVVDGTVFAFQVAFQDESLELHDYETTMSVYLQGVAWNIGEWCCCWYLLRLLQKR